MPPERILIEGPVVPVVSLAEARRQLRLTEPDEDQPLELYIAAAAGRFDPSAGGFLGHALRPQTWEYQLDGFPTASCDAAFAEIALPYPPLIAIASVKYDDLAGVEQTLAAGTDYRVIGAGGRNRAAIAPPHGGSWPSARLSPGSVRIRYSCGYAAATAETPDTMPAPLKQAVLLLVGNSFQNREAVITGTIATTLPFGVDGLIAPYRDYGP